MIREKGSYFSKHKKIDDYRKFFITSCYKGIHPAEKPVSLIERYIRVSSREGDTVLDPFMGSGTTAVAAIRNNRQFIGFEIDENYYNIAAERIANIDDIPDEEEPESEYSWLDELLEESG
jgi:DNA modification methylase